MAARRPLRYRHCPIARSLSVTRPGLSPACAATRYFTLGSAPCSDGRIAALICDFSDPEDQALDWLAGRMLAHAPATPLRLRTRARSGTLLPVLRQTPLPLMSAALAAALCQAGVSNLVTFPAEIQTGAVLSTDFCAFNLIGMLGGEAPGHGPLLSPSRLDAAGARDLLMFRVKGAPYALLVTDTLRSRLSAFPGLSYTPAEEWTA
jgi:hypothetical protein